MIGGYLVTFSLVAGSNEGSGRVTRELPAGEINVRPKLPVNQQRLKAIAERRKAELKGSFRVFQELPEPERTLKSLFLRLLFASLTEDVDQYMSYIHPDGVRDGSVVYTRDQVRASITERNRLNEYQRFRIADVLDVKKIAVTVFRDGRYRLEAPTKIKYVEGEMYFDDTLWYVFEKSANGKWLVVELD